MKMIADGGDKLSIAHPLYVNPGNCIAGGDIRQVCRRLQFVDLHAGRVIRNDLYAGSFIVLAADMKKRPGRRSGRRPESR